MNDYQKTFTVTAAPNVVYAAITQHIADWWSNDLNGGTAQIGDKYSIAFGKIEKTFEVIEAIPGKHVTWKCLHAHIDLASLKNKSEWVGTTITWTITTEENGTTLSFLHYGLNQSCECYQVCEAGWDMFLASLQKYLTTGKGSPYLKAELV